MMTSGPAKTLPATRVAAPINARTVFISLSAVLTTLQRAGGSVNLSRVLALGGRQVLRSGTAAPQAVNGRPSPDCLLAARKGNQPGYVSPPATAHPVRQVSRPPSRPNCLRRARRRWQRRLNWCWHREYQGPPELRALPARHWSS